MQSIKIAVAEDSKVVREAIVKYLHTDRSINVVIKASNGLELLHSINNFGMPDIILTDIRMPIMNGIEATEQILKINPLAKVIAWTIFDDEDKIVTMSTLGVKSFVLKKDEKEIIRAIKIVHEGGTYLPDKIAGILRRYLERGDQEETNFIELSELEKSLLRLICSGYSSTRIGELLGKSARTIEDYRNNLYQKFQVKNKEQLIVKVTKRRLL